MTPRSLLQMTHVAVAMHQKLHVTAGDLEKSMGVLLVDFLRLFGRSLNNEDVGISCVNGGFFFNKVDAQKDQPLRTYMLSVEDPADSDNDLCKGSFNFPKVWAWALQQQSASCHIEGLTYDARDTFSQRHVDDDRPLYMASLMPVTAFTPNC